MKTYLDCVSSNYNLTDCSDSREGMWKSCMNCNVKHFILCLNLTFWNFKHLSYSSNSITALEDYQGHRRTCHHITYLNYNIPSPRKKWKYSLSTLNFLHQQNQKTLVTFLSKLSQCVGTTTRLLQEHWRTNLDDLIRLLYKSYELLFYKNRRSLIARSLSSGRVVVVVGG